MKKHTTVTRREFVAAAGAVAAATIVPARVLARNGEVPPSEKINIAGIGVGGHGRRRHRRRPAREGRQHRRPVRRGLGLRRQDIGGIPRPSSSAISARCSTRWTRRSTPW